MILKTFVSLPDITKYTVVQLKKIGNINNICSTFLE